MIENGSAKFLLYINLSLNLSPPLFSLLLRILIFEV